MKLCFADTVPLSEEPTAVLKPYLYFHVIATSLGPRNDFWEALSKTARSLQESSLVAAPEG